MDIVPRQVAMWEEQLEPMKPSALKKHAAAVGVSKAQLDEADDAESPKDFLTALMLAILRDGVRLSPAQVHPAADSQPTQPTPTARN
jgi:hypothetical protein